MSAEKSETGTEAAGADCALCGACCRTFPIYASAADAEREPRIAAEGLELAPWLCTERWVWRLHPLPFHERCCFLGEGNRCAVYATRPAVCREFAPGGGQCRDARERLGLAPLAAGASAPDRARARARNRARTRPRG